MSADKKPTVVSGSEVDWLYARRWYNWNAGDGRYIKRTMNRRFRKEVPKLIQQEILEVNLGNL